MDIISEFLLRGGVSPPLDEYRSEDYREAYRIMQRRYLENEAALQASLIDLCHHGYEENIKNREALTKFILRISDEMGSAVNERMVTCFLSGESIRTPLMEAYILHIMEAFGDDVTPKTIVDEMGD